MYAFKYHKPGSVSEASSLLSGSEDAKLLAGGHTYIPTLKQRLAQPSDVIDLSAIAELKGIREENGGITVGAMTTHGEVALTSVVQPFAALASTALDLLADQVAGTLHRRRAYHVEIAPDLSIGASSVRAG